MVTAAELSKHSRIQAKEKQSFSARKTQKFQTSFYAQVTGIYGGGSSEVWTVV